MLQNVQISFEYVVVEVTGVAVRVHTGLFCQHLFKLQTWLGLIWLSF